MAISQQRLDEALAEFQALTKRQPRPVQAHTVAGVILEAQNKPQEARKHYEQALALDPDMPVRANNLAWMFAETGENLDWPYSWRRRPLTPSEQSRDSRYARLDLLQEGARGSSDRAISEEHRA